MNIKSMFIELYREKYGDHINAELAHELVEDMAVTDGSSRDTGEKWTVAECRSYGEKMGVNWEKVNINEWYVVMNMNYSDHYRTGKKYNINDASFYADLTYDWFTDVDAKADKTFNYFLG